MTRTLQITNMSNHDGEDYEITMEVYKGELVKYTIQPGETIMVENAHVANMMFYKPFESKEPVPFRNEDGEQMSPWMNVGIG